MTPRKPYTLTVRSAEFCTVLIDLKLYARGRDVHEYLEVAPADDWGRKHNDPYTYRSLIRPDDPLARWQGRERAVSLVGADAIRDAERAVERAIRDKTRTTKAGRETWQYKLIAAEAQDVGWPTHYATDLTEHDARRIMREDPQVFLWVLRECGTHMITDRDSMEWRVAYARADGRDRRFYRVERGGLRQLTPEQFIGFSFTNWAREHADTEEHADA